MNKPTLEEVKEHFKDAKVVKSLFQDTNEERYRGELNLDSLHEFGRAYWCNTKPNEYCLEVWQPDEGYAEIIKYKNQDKKMRKVIRLDEPKEESKKPIELTHFFHKNNGWRENREGLGEIKNLSYIGKCPFDGDMFIARSTRDNCIEVFKGHLNDGVY